ncbi:hypothetical protein [Endozoicomonas euniceicola]|uniref:Uncharacterized protein n=1 Tax=Endozoicomonas euniceicola TaxID=1234143 RepID=A0ABY6GU85_9GAMM|nr:hypothetical protein [Endozoicomonas euniceicola]UYM16319.1 hypothetical protein NX720_26585 [Endozoicomonas euniceicola]
MNELQRQAVMDLDEKLKKLIKFDSDRIYSRPEWGSVLSFESYRGDFERSFGLARIFIDLPFYLLPDQELNQIGNVIQQASSHFEQIDDFDSSTANNPQQTVRTLGEQVKKHADTITVQMAQWISYLAYQKGDVSRNIKNLEEAIETGEGIIKAAKGRIETQEGLMKKIIQQAQDFAGDKGVTIFTEQFNNAANENAAEAKTWLKITAGIFAVTISMIVIFMYQLIGVSAWYEWASRATLIAVLISGGIWCGSIYRILRHQQTINLQKANGLKSFLLFRDAADNDEATRNAVLLETTKSIFSTSSSGFVNEGSNQSGSEIKVIESTRLASNVTSVGRNTKTLTPVE